MNYFTNVVHLFQEGGAFMYPILIVLVVGIAIAIERYIFLSRAESENHKFWKGISGLIAQGKIDDAEALAQTSPTAVGRIFAGGLSRARSGGGRGDIEMAMEESLMMVMPMFEKRTHYLATLANVATLLGLLGTVVGMIAGFAAISSANPAEKISLLSAAISEAMNCTAFGLIAAIPMLLLHSWLSTKGNELVDGLEAASVRLINGLVRSNG